MKKLILIFIFLISLSFVNAISFSTITMIGGQVGLQMPAEMTEIIGQFSEAQQEIVCITSIFDCATSQIKGKLIGNAFDALPPEMKKTVNTYNQIKGYTDQVKGIVSELKVNSDTGSISGCLPTKDKLKNVCTNNINFKYDEQTKISTYEFEDKNGDFSINNPKYSLNFTNVKSKDASTNAYVKVGEKGEVIEADLTTNERGSSFVFGDKKIDVPANTRVTFNAGQITVYSDKETDFSFSDYADGKSINQKDYKILGKGNVVFTGYGAEISPSVGLYDKKFDASYMNNGDNILFVTDNKENIGPYTDKSWIVANEDSLEFNAKARINFGKDNPWVKMEDTDKLSMDFDAEGILAKNTLNIKSGNVITLNCENKITYQTNLFYTDNEEFCVPMTFISETGIYILNGDGSAEFQFCSQPPVTGGSVFDMLTGRAIQWITGKASEGCKQYIVSDKKFSTTNKKYDPSNTALLNDEYIIIDGKCISNIGIFDSKNNRCFYDKNNLGTLQGLVNNPLYQKEILSLSSQLKGSEIVTIAKPEVTAYTKAQLYAKLPTEAPKISPSPKPIEKKCKELIQCDYDYSVCNTNAKDDKTKKTKCDIINVECINSASTVVGCS